MRLVLWGGSATRMNDEARESSIFCDMANAYIRDRLGYDFAEENLATNRLGRLLQSVKMLGY